MTTGYLSLAERRAELIRKALQGSVFIAPPTAAAINITSLFDPDSGDLTALPAGYTDIGIVTDAGVKLSEAIKTADIDGWGFNEPVRSDITGDTTTLVVEAQETKMETIGLYTGVDPTTFVPASNGTLAIPKPLVSTPLRYRVLVVAVDESAGGEIVIARFLPAMQVTDITDQVLANADAAITWGVTMTAYVDTTLGFAQEFIFGGAGWLALVGDEEVPRIVTCTTASSTALVATAGTFTAFDVGRHAAGAGIPAGATIATFTDATHVVLSAAATASATGVAVTIS